MSASCTQFKRMKVWAERVQKAAKRFRLLEKNKNLILYPVMHDFGVLAGIPNTYTVLFGRHVCRMLFLLHVYVSTSDFIETGNFYLMSFHFITCQVNNPRCCWLFVWCIMLSMSLNLHFMALRRSNLVQ